MSEPKLSVEPQYTGFMASVSEAMLDGLVDYTICTVGGAVVGGAVGGGIGLKLKGHPMFGGTQALTGAIIGTVTGTVTGSTVGFVRFFV